MGLLSNITGAIASAAGSTIKAIPAVFSHPVTAITKGITAAEKQLYDKSLTGQLADAAKAGTAYAVAAVAGTSSVVRGAVSKVVTPVVSSVGKTIAANPVKTAIIALPVAGAIAAQPGKTIQAIASTPTGLVNVGKNVANLAAEPSVENAKTLVTENPVIVGSAAAAAAIGIGKTLIPAIATATQTSAIKEQTKAIENATSSINAPVPVAAAPVASIPTAPQTPITPATQPLIASAGSGTSTSKRKKRSSKAVMAPINQKVNVIVNNRSSSIGIRQTKKYLNREVLYS